MKINTKYFGEISIDDVQKIHFPLGIIGFEDRKDYVLIHFEQDDDTMMCLQSVDDPYTAFVVMNPHYITNEYQPQIDDRENAELETKADTPVLLYVLAVVHEDFKDTTVNLRCPIVINCEKNLAKQVILEDASLPMRYPLFAEKKEG